MKLVLFEYICSNCGSKFKAGQLPPTTYGAFLLRKKGSDAVLFLDAIEDVSYSEVSDELKISNLTKDKSELERSGILQEIFGIVACDPDIDGVYFEIGLPPPCPNCANQKVSSWRMIEPAETLEIGLDQVTHVIWNGLARLDKINRINKVLKRILGNVRI